MSETFEDPRKTDMRARAEIAVDDAGHELVQSPVSFPLGGGLRGAIRGDLQSLDGHQVRHAYYLRPEAKRPVPQWLINVAKDARTRENLVVHAVVVEVTDQIVKSCRAGRVGLLLLREENTFEQIVDPSAEDSEEIAAQLRDRIKTARRRMENKLNLNRSDIEERFSKVNELTRGMDHEVRDRYIESVERAGTSLDEWGTRVSTMLDEAAGNGDETLIESAEALIEAGVETA